MNFSFSEALLDWFLSIPINILKIIQSFIALEWFRTVVLILKILAGVLSILFLAGVVYFLRKSSFLKVKYFQNMSDFLRSGSAIESGKIGRRWKDILKKSESPEETNWKLAVLDADGILDELLAGMGYKGATTDERLSQVQPIHLQTIEEITKAHDVRNEIARNPTYKLTKERAKELLDVYRKTFEIFELI